MEHNRTQPSVPDWFSKGSVYQIYPRSFCERGMIGAVTEELPFLAELGFSTVYLCPIFEEDSSTDEAHISPRQRASGTGNPKNPYRMNDYFAIDPEYGTMDDLRAFVDEAHRLGLHVLLDLVYLHIGPNAPILARHPHFAAHTANGERELTKWGFPKLNYADAGLREYLWSNMTYYVGALDVDGFRCDVGDDVPLDFWIEGKRRIRAIKPDAVLINEGRDWNYLKECFDASYCFDWHSAVYAVLKGKKPCTAIRACHESLAAVLPEGAILLRDIDNHDTVTDWSVRVECLVGHEGMELLQVLNYCIDGVPMVFCGNELGDGSHLNMFANRFYWGEYEASDRSIRTKDYSLRRQALMRALNSLKRESGLLQKGDTLWLNNSAPEQILSFARHLDGQTLLFVGNLTDKPCTVSVDGISIPDVDALLSRAVSLRREDGVLALAPYGYLVIQF